MGLDVEDVIARLDPAERRKVEEMAVEFIAEEMKLREAPQGPPAHPGQRRPRVRRESGRRVPDGAA